MNSSASWKEYCSLKAKVRKDYVLKKHLEFISITKYEITVPVWSTNITAFREFNCSKRERNPQWSQNMLLNLYNPYSDLYIAEMLIWRTNVLSTSENDFVPWKRPQTFGHRSSFWLINLSPEITKTCHHCMPPGRVDLFLIHGAKMWATPPDVRLMKSVRPGLSLTQCHLPLIFPQKCIRDSLHKRWEEHNMNCLTNHDDTWVRRESGHCSYFHESPTQQESVLTLKVWGKIMSPAIIL